MMNVERPPTYSTEDFSVVNQYVDRMAQRHNAAILLYNAHTREVYLKWAVALLAVCGLSAALIIWAWSALLAKPEPTIVRPHVVQPPEVKVFIDGTQFQGDVSRPQTQSPIETVRRAAEDRVEQVSSGTGSAAAVGAPPREPAAVEVLNFVLFREIPFVRGKINQVHVGMRYDKTGDDKPSSQWCYVTTPNPTGSAARVTLSNKIGDHRMDELLTLAMARDVGVSLADLTLAQTMCRFE